MRISDGSSDVCSSDPSISMADFLDGVGAVGVTIPFAEVVPSIQQGVVDCGVTGLLSDYEAKWWQVTHRYFSVSSPERRGGKECVSKCRSRSERCDYRYLS